MHECTCVITVLFNMSNKTTRFKVALNFFCMKDNPSNGILLVWFPWIALAFYHGEIMTFGVCRHTDTARLMSFNCAAFCSLVLKSSI